MYHKECLLVNHKKYLRVKGGRGAVDERYVTLGGVPSSVTKRYNRGWGVSSFPEKSVT